MQVIDRKSPLWEYLSSETRGLFEDGELVLTFVDKHKNTEKLSDYSFIVFPFAKAFEGFLKKLFLDLEMITIDEYYGDEIRIGRILNPHYQKESGNVFLKLCNHSIHNGDIPHRMWETWKKGRNLVFHFFPHNYRRLRYEDAVGIVNDIVDCMELAIASCRFEER